MAYAVSRRAPLVLFSNFMTVAKAKFDLSTENFLTCKVTSVIWLVQFFFSLVQIQNRLHRAFFKYSDRNLAAANVEIFRDVIDEWNVGILTHPVFLGSLSQT